MKRTLLLTVALLAAAWSSGCSLTGTTSSFFRQTWSVFRPNPTDYRDTSEEPDDEWSAVGREARGDRPLEKENDPLKKFLMSEKARSIERSLGIE